MTDTQISSFIRDCVVFEDDTENGLDFDTFYGLYISWCVLGRKIPIPDSAFKTALGLEGLRPIKENGRRIYPGMSMVGAAARDYVMNSVPLWSESETNSPVLSDFSEEAVPSIA
ncbi:hypothetical protein WBN73_16330 [Paenarthrobacter sp. CCNWLY172]|uniref:DNA primase/nucleoside triphosphatase C-terminal domain-containing protein n=1 Tax=Paenarthrobacter sp. AMU7 TaxID=3162492 RepID=A0AB39YQQ5_9MICC|nr:MULTISPECIES: hypothetical protein [Micrococcaceae]QSZ47474.1 hypothetical protein AYX22_02955 [Arthrobacter sp. D5-1]WGM21123.1 hypothetical protein QEH68_02720 [Paenarthrobacter sp. OM7]